MTDIQFIHLHGHSYYSNVGMTDALVAPSTIARKAQSLAMPAIALTDHASVMGAPAFVKECEKHNVKPIIGCELYVTNDLEWRPADKEDKSRRKYKHLVALAKNWEGFIELMELLSLANRDDHFYYKPRNSIEEVCQTKNLIFLTACAGGLLCDGDAEKDVEDIILTCGKDRVLFEIQPHNTPEQISVNTKAVDMAAFYGSGLVATQDFHYAEKEDSRSHEVLLAVGQGKSWTDSRRWKYPVNDLYIKSGSEMIQAFAAQVMAGNLTGTNVADAVRNTKIVADACNVTWQKIPISLPVVSAFPDREIMRRCTKALQEKGLTLNPIYFERLKYEFDVIRKSGFLMYFLLLGDIIDWCREQNIMVGPGRGSSAGSLICYLIGITRVDPIIHGLLFERFYRPGRIDLPDIDTDFEDERREEVLDYIRDTYGEEFVAGVANYMKYGAKSAIKGVAKTFDVSFQDVNKATSRVPRLTDDDDVWNHQDIKPFLASNPLVEPYARPLVGCMFGLGQHAAGFVISGVPLAGRTAVWRKDGRTIACWDKRTIEDMGLMKLDVLGLRTLSILRNAADMVKARSGRVIDFDAIRLDDTNTLKLFDSGKTTGVFQFESGGMRSLLKSLDVNDFSVLVDANALYRPGPMDLIPIYSAVQTGKTNPIYEHPLLEPILSTTHGVMIYQEQLMTCFRDIGGFSYAEADKMRKIVSKSMGADEFEKHMGAFVAGAVKTGLDERTAASIFNKMIDFAGYGFNKSHAVCYSLIAFWCMWMKRYHPAEFYAAHISNSNDDQVISACEEADKLGLNIKMPDIDRSLASQFAVVDDNTLLAPLTTIDGVGENIANSIVKARLGKMDNQGLGIGETKIEKTGTKTFDPTNVQSGLFKNEKNFLERVYKRLVNKRVQETLNKIGATNWSEYNQQEIHENRMKYLGAIARTNMSVSTSDLLLLDDFTVEKVNDLYKGAFKLAADIRMMSIDPKVGAKPKLMIIFDKPGYKDERYGSAGHDDTYHVIAEILKEEIKMNARSFYTTHLYKMRKPPLGYDDHEEFFTDMMTKEIKLLKPPMILALGSGPIKFFCGKDARVGENNAKMTSYNGIPVVCGLNPYAAIVEPKKREDLVAVGEKLAQLYE